MAEPSVNRLNQVSMMSVDKAKWSGLVWTDSSLKPFSLKELIEFLDNSSQGLGYPGGLSLSYNNSNADSGLDRESLEDFTTISSEIYPQLEKHYDRVFADWVAEEKEEVSL